FPRYFLEKYAGEAAVGTFSALAVFMLLGAMVTGSFGQTASPRLSAHHAAGDAAAFRGLLLRLVVVTLAIGAAAVAGALLLGRPVLALVYRAEYAEHQRVFVWLMVSAAIGQVDGLLGVAVTAMRLFRPQVPVHGLATGLGVALFAWLVARHGLLGAAWASL